MTIFRRVPVLSSGLLLLAASTPAAVRATDPATFFGGTDNQAYLDWVATTSYDNSEFIATAADPAKGIALHWTIVNDSEIELAIAGRTTGWMGFGISENGGMRGSDMLLFESARPDQIIDAHVLGTREQPIVDDCQSWEFVDSDVGTDFMAVQVKRSLDTGDTQDIPIIDDSSLAVSISRVIAAFGESDVVSYHGVNSARSGVRWFNQGISELALFEQTMQQESEGSFFVGASNYTIPAQETEYAYFCFNAANLESQGVPLNEGAHVIGFEPLVVTPAHVHHFIVYASTSDNNEQNATCDFNNYIEMTYLWAPGDPPLVLPSVVGGPLGGSDGGFRSFMIEIHYDNPSLVENVVDSSGVRHYWTQNKRPNDLGIFAIGDPFVQLRGESVGDGLVTHEFDCPAGCQSTVLQGNVNVVRELHHMHETGTASFLRHYRDGNLLRTGRVQYFDFQQQGGQAVVQQPYTIEQGDSFEYHCFFDGQNRSFGLGSRDEMCIVFLAYWPRQSIPTLVGSFPWFCGEGFDEFGLSFCDVDHVQGAVTDDAALLRTFGNPPDQCPANVTGTETSTTTSGASSRSLSSFVSVVAAAIAGLFL